MMLILSSTLATSAFSLVDHRSWQRSGPSCSRERENRRNSTSRSTLSFFLRPLCRRCIYSPPHIEQKEKGRKGKVHTHSLRDHSLFLSVSTKQRRREKQAYCVSFSFQTASRVHFTSLFIETIFSVRIDTHFQPDYSWQLHLPSSNRQASRSQTYKPSVSGLSIKALSLMRNKYCLILNQNTHTHGSVITSNSKRIHRHRLLKR